MGILPSRCTYAPVFAPSPTLAAYYPLYLGDDLLKLKKFEEAESHLKRSYRIMEENYGLGHQGSRRAAALLVEICEIQNRAEEAEAWRVKLDSQTMEPIE